MSFSEWGYSATQALPAELVSTDPAAIDALVQRDTGATKSPNTYRESSAPTLNGFNVYPVSRTGAAPDEWFVLDPAADVPAYVAGILYDIQLGFREMTYQEAKSKARRDLGDYITAYRRSFFTAGGDTFSASDIFVTTYNSIGTFIQSKWMEAQLAGDSTPVLVLDFWILDVNDVEHQIVDVPGWNSFVNKWDNLWDDAQTHALTAWQSIKAGSTTADVRAAMAALPPIPTIP